MIERMAHYTPFDALASTYDAKFSASPIARELRGRAQARLAARFPAGAAALELGCGTGEDALWLARRGVRVTATDSSAAMLDAARARLAGEPLVRVAALDLAQLPAEFGGPYDGVFSSFGPLNCLPEWTTLAHWLAGRVRPGGYAAFGVMSRVCLWEIGWHGLHGDWRTAGRRLRGMSGFQAEAAGPPLAISYPTIGAFTHAFAPWFRRTHLEALGLFLPPTDVYGVIERRPRLLRSLLALDRRLGRAGWLAACADHFWIEFARTDTPV
jgi:SAM-dependent methyltransferase